MGGRPLSRTTFYAMLSDPFYAGLVRLRDGRTYLGAHPPMITMDDFHRNQEILGRSGRERPQRHSFAFTGILKCGHCGGGITAEEHVKQSGKRYVYYHCSRRRAGVVCHEPAVSEAALVAQLGREFRYLRMPEAIHAWLCREALAETGAERERARQVHRTIEQALEGVGREEGNLLDLRTRDIITDEIFLAKRRHLEERRASLQQQSRADATKAATGKDLVEVFTFAARAQEVLQTGTAVQRRMILEAVGLNYTLRGRRTAFSLRQPFDRIAAAGSLSNWSGCLDDVRTVVLDEGVDLGRLARLTDQVFAANGVEATAA